MYLVASMSVATALLLWMEHLVAPPGEAMPVVDDGTDLVDAVASGAIDPARWDEIVISYRDRVPGDPAVALAVPGRPLPYHFVIQPNGKVHTLPTWGEQNGGQSADLSSRAIRVCLAGRPDSDSIGPEQWDALMGMIRQLRVHCQLPTKSVRLDPQSDPHYRPNMSNQAHRLRQMLLAADVID